MSENKSDHHVYDGIIEQNNPMPDWWIWLFILSVIFGFIYWLHYAVGGGLNLKDEYNMAMKTYQENIEKSEQNIATDTEEALMQFMKVEGNLSKGAVLYAEKCAMCHGAQLEGKVGPNLTDNYWIHGSGNKLDIVNVVKKGVPSKGMLAWEGLLRPNELKSIVVYIFSKIGSRPANAKAPEGREIK